MNFYEVNQMLYFVWESHTCFVCSGGTGIPTYHASSKGPKATSPCDSVGEYISADSRRGALKIYKSRRPES